MPSPKELAKALAYQGEIRNTSRNRLLGGVADLLAPVSEFADRDKLPESIPLLGGMSFADLSGLKGAQSLVNDMSYGTPPIRGASLQTAKVDPRVLDLAGVSGAMIPVGKALGKAALREGARQIETGTGIGRAVVDPRSPITTWHGSPHTFPPTANNPLGEFDSAKMGTGEGAQVYGKGHYTAEARKGAESYQNAGIGGIDWENAKYGNKKIQTLYDNAAKAQDRAHRLKDQGAIGKANAELAYWESMMTGTHPNIVKQNALDPESGWDELANFAKKIDDSKFKNINYPETSLYKVDIPDEHVAKMLDYDKPINEQSPYILEALGRAGINNESSALAGPMARGQESHLAKHGITGIRYLDAASRDAGKGTSNFVVFDPKHMNILERNGVGGAMMQRPKTEFEILHDTAQRNAALPVEQGGLGLPANNTYIDRANAPGMFPEDAVHFSRAGGDYTTLDSGKYAIAPFDAVGTHVGTPQAAMERFQNTVGYKVNDPNYINDELKGTSYPVRISNSNPLMNQNGMPFGEEDLNTLLRQAGGHNSPDISGGDRELNAKLRKKLFEDQGYTNIPYFNEVEGRGSVSQIVPPSNIRSRFAAFDPMRRHEADLLAGVGVGGMLDPQAIAEALRQQDRK